MKKRLIELLRTLYPQKTKKELYAYVVCGEVFVDGECHRDPAVKVSQTSEIVFRKKRYVSRGGVKLEAALTRWDVPVQEMVFLDVGASTGGFTDCLLQHGASRVHTIDVGYNQLDYKLRRDTRVCVHEKTNIMEITSLYPTADAAVADLSFRSLSGAAQQIFTLVSQGWLIALIKPQFEIATPDDGFDGVIRDVDTLRDVLSSTLLRLYAEGVYVERLLESPITGTKGNREFLGLFHDRPYISQFDLLEQIDNILKISS